MVVRKANSQIPRLTKFTIILKGIDFCTRVNGNFMMSVNGENRVWVSALLMLVPMSQSKMNASSSIPFTWCMTMRKKGISSTFKLQASFSSLHVMLINLFVMMLTKKMMHFLKKFAVLKKFFGDVCAQFHLHGLLPKSIELCQKAKNCTTKWWLL